ncbi:DUF6054 family protein [Oceanobacillus sp. CAU 1775]
MKYLEFTLDIQPSNAVQKILSDNKIKPYLVFNDHKRIGDNNLEMFVMVFDKFFLRTNSNASLTVTIDNINEITIVKCISTGGGSGLLQLSWGTSRDFITLVKNVLAPKATDIIKESQ